MYHILGLHISQLIHIYIYIDINKCLFFPSYPPSRPLVLPRRLLWGVGGEAFAEMIRDDKVVEKRLFFDDFLVDLLWFSSIFFDFLCFSRIFSKIVSSSVESGNPMKSERKKAMEVYRWEHRWTQRQKVGIRPARLGSVFLETAETENWRI